MKWLFLLANLPSLACVAVAGMIVWKYGPDASGWGWFLFGAVILHAEVKYKSGRQ